MSEILSGWLEMPLASRIALTLVHFLWQGMLLGLLFWLIGALLRNNSARARYNVFLAGLLAMTGCAVATFAVLKVDVPKSVLPASGSAVIASLPSPESRNESASGSAEFDSTGTGIPLAVESEIPAVEGPTADAPPTTDTSSPSKTATVESSGRPDVWQQTTPFIAVAYLVGVLVLLIRLLLGLRGGWKLRRHSEPVDEPALLGLLARRAAALKMRVAPALCRCRDIAVPTVVGIFRPTILLPISLVAGLSPDQLEAILTHELAHIRRYDHLVNILQRVAEAVLFFHPAVWWISRRIRVERENCCDDLVVELGAEPVRYAELLVDLAEHDQRSRPLRGVALVTALQATAGQSQVAQRVKRLLGVPIRNTFRLSRGGVVAVFAIGAILISAMVALRTIPLESAAADDQNDSLASALSPDDVVNEDDVLNFDSAEGVWNYPLIGLARSRGADGSYYVIDLNFGATGQKYVSPQKLKMPADATIAELAEKFGAGDIAVVEPDLVQPVRGTLVAPLRLKPVPDDVPVFLAMKAAVDGMTRSEIIKQIRDQAAEETPPPQDAAAGAPTFRLVPGRFYGALRADGKLVLMGAHGKAGDVWVQFVPLPALDDAAQASERSPRETVAQFLRNLKQGRSREAIALTAPDAHVGWGNRLTSLLKLDRIQLLHQANTDERAVIVSDTFRDNSDREQAYYATLQKHDGQWLVQSHGVTSPDGAFLVLEGFATNPGVAFDVIAAELVGPWRVNVCECTIVMAADGTGTELPEGPGGPEPGAKPIPFKWEAKGNTLTRRFADRQEILDIQRVEENVVQLVVRDGGASKYWVKSNHNHAAPANAQDGAADAGPMAAYTKTLALSGEYARPFLNLATGETFAPPEGIAIQPPFVAGDLLNKFAKEPRQDKPNALQQWAEKNGVTFGLVQYDGRPWLQFFGHTAYPISDAQEADRSWESMTPEELREGYRQGGFAMLPFEAYFGIDLTEAKLPQTWLLVNLGLLRIERFTGGDAPTVTLKVKLLDGSHTHKHTAALGDPTFGPVHETTLDSVAHAAIDLESGKRYPMPPVERPNDEALVKWLRDSRIDFLFTSAGELRGIASAEAFLTPRLDNAAWGAMSAGEVLVHRELEAGKLDYGDVKKPKADYPATYLFKTREGGKGILQIVGFEDRPRNLMIRYKLVEAAAAEQRHFVCLVVGKERLTFEGEDATWEKLPELLDNVPSRGNTVFEFAVASSDFTIAEVNETTARCKGLSKQFGFEYPSYTGVKPLGSKGSPGESRVASEETPKARPQGNSGNAFGRVVERVVGFDVTKKEGYLDLETGEHVAYNPLDKNAKDRDALKNVDIANAMGESNMHARYGRQMVAIPVAQDRWNATVAEVRREVEKAKLQGQVRLGPAKATYFIKTRAGSIGILQFEPHDKSELVTIRYKLFRTPGNSKDGGAFQSSTSLEVQILDDQGKAVRNAAVKLAKATAGYPKERPQGSGWADKDGLVKFDSIAPGRHQFVVNPGWPSAFLYEPQVPATGLKTQLKLKPAPDWSTDASRRPQLDVKVKPIVKEGKELVEVTLTNEGTEPYTLSENDLRFFYPEFIVYPPKSQQHAGLVLPPRRRATKKITLDWSEYVRNGIWCAPGHVSFPHPPTALPKDQMYVRIEVAQTGSLAFAVKKPEPIVARFDRKEAAKPPSDRATSTRGSIHPDITNIHGAWRITSQKSSDVSFGNEARETGDRISIQHVGQSSADELNRGDLDFLNNDRLMEQRDSWDFPYVLDPTSTPKQFNIAVRSDNQLLVQKGIYRLDGHLLTLCVGPLGGERPESFEVKAGQQRCLLVLSRITRPAYEMGWGEPVDGLRFRWLPLKAPARAGSSPEVHVQVQNISDKPIVWQCKNAITWALQRSTDESTWRLFKFEASPLAGSRAARASEVKEQFGIEYPGLTDGDPVPGYYQLQPGSLLILTAELPWKLAAAGKVTLQAQIARYDPTTSRDLPGNQLTCPPLVIQVVAANDDAPQAAKAKLDFLADVPEFRELNLKITEEQLKQIIVKHKLVDRTSTTGGQTSHMLYNRGGECVIVMFRDGKCSGIQRMRADRDFGLIWGKPVDGLQATVALLPNRESHPINSRIDVRLFLRNAGDKDIQLGTWAGRQSIEDVLFVEDEQGNSQSVGGAFYSGDVDLIRQKLAPGEVLSSLQTVIGMAADAAAMKELKEPLPFTLMAKPGKYRLRFKLNISKLDKNEPQWQGSVETGSCRLHLLKPPRSKRSPLQKKQSRTM